MTSVPQIRLHPLGTSFHICHQLLSNGTTPNLKRIIFQRLREYNNFIKLARCADLSVRFTLFPNNKVDLAEVDAKI